MFHLLLGQKLLSSGDGLAVGWSACLTGALDSRIPGEAQDCMLVCQHIAQSNSLPCADLPKLILRQGSTCLHFKGLLADIRSLASS